LTCCKNVDADTVPLNSRVLPGGGGGGGGGGGVVVVVVVVGGGTSGSAIFPAATSPLPFAVSISGGVGFPAAQIASRNDSQRDFSPGF
jgi:hypothetical protein